MASPTAQPLSEVYTRANQQVQNLLKPGWDGGKFEPERYWENFCDWLEDHPVAMGDALKALAIPAEQVEDDYQVLRGLDPDASYSVMPAWLTKDYEDDLAVYLEGRGAHLAPTSAHLTAQRSTLLPRTTWLVHFTYQAEAVAREGFRKGFADHRRLGLTMHFPEEAPEKAGTGYNFAFLAQGNDALQAALTDHYGDGAVMFQGSGVQAYHKGDEEVQVMFRGDQVDPSHLVHLKQWHDRSWSVMSKTSRRALVTGTFPQCTAWVEQHFQQYQNQFAVSPGAYNKQTMQLNEEFLQENAGLLQEAVARYCSERQDDILSGKLTQDQLNEGILSGIQAVFGKGSAVRQAAGDLTSQAVDKFQSAKQAVGQGVERLRNDYVAGDASSELRRLAQQRNEAEEGFEMKMNDFKEHVRAIQQERYALKKEHRALMRQFHQSAHAQYVRAAQALKIPVAKGDAFYDAVDAALETRNLVPVVLHESWGQLDEEMLEEGPWSPGYEPTEAEQTHRAEVFNARRDAREHSKFNPTPRAVAAHIIGNIGDARQEIENARDSGQPRGFGRIGARNSVKDAHLLNQMPRVKDPLLKATPLGEAALEEEQAFFAQPNDPTDPAVASARAQQRAAAPATPRAQVASDLQNAGQIRQFVQNPLTGTPPSDTQPQKDAAKAYLDRARQTAAPVPAALAEDAPQVPSF